MHIIHCLFFYLFSIIGCIACLFLSYYLRATYYYTTTTWHADKNSKRRRQHTRVTERERATIMWELLFSILFVSSMHDGGSSYMIILLLLTNTNGCSRYRSQYVIRDKSQSYNSIINYSSMLPCCPFMCPP